MSRVLRTVLFLVGAVLLAACAAGVNPTAGVAPPDGDVAGFWMGLWHGIIAPVTFVVSLFTDDVSLYEVHNSGNWYDFGFVLGAGILFGGGSRTVSR
ncbi:MAG TPA: hypothetical protein VLB67_11510 [Acidimicrobiia bacterium]|nr:hypothetical protein [Acidimicrobiia bacterium]